MLPTDIESFAFGFDLQAASYSGGAGGTFANLNPDGEDWLVDGATPSFSIKNGLEGMDFTADLTQSILGEMRATYENTILVIGEIANGISLGGINAAANSCGMYHNGNRLSPFTAAASTTWNPYTGAQANVHVVSFCPASGKLYSQTNNDILVEDTPALPANARWFYFNAGIGRHRVTPLTGWVSRVLVFSRALHFRDTESLEALVATEMAKVGL